MSMDLLTSESQPAPQASQMDADVAAWAAVGLELMSELVPGCRGDGEMAGHGPVLWAEPRPLTCSLSSAPTSAHTAL